MFLHLSSATHYIPSRGIIYSVACTPGNIECFKNMNIFPGHFCISYKKACCRKCTKPASDNVCGFFLNSVRLFRFCKCLIITACIINSLTVFFMLPKFRIFILRMLIVAFPITLTLIISSL